MLVQLAKQCTVKCHLMKHLQICQRCPPKASVRCLQQPVHGFPLLGSARTAIEAAALLLAKHSRFFSNPSHFAFLAVLGWILQLFLLSRRSERPRTGGPQSSFLHSSAIAPRPDLQHCGMSAQGFGSQGAGHRFKNLPSSDISSLIQNPQELLRVT